MLTQKASVIFGRVPTEQTSCFPSLYKFFITRYRAAHNSIFPSWQPSIVTIGKTIESPETATLWAGLKKD